MDRNARRLMVSEDGTAGPVRQLTCGVDARLDVRDAFARATITISAGELSVCRRSALLDGQPYRVPNVLH